MKKIFIFLVFVIVSFMANAQENKIPIQWQGKEGEVFKSGKSLKQERVDIPHLGEERYTSENFVHSSRVQAKKIPAKPVKPGNNNFSTIISKSTKAAGTVFFEDFEDAPADNSLPEGWTGEPTPGGNQWTTQKITLGSSYVPGHSGSRYATISYNSSVAHDAWLYTPALNLTAGKAYDISFWITLAGYGGAYERLEVKLGTEATSTGMTELVYDSGPSTQYSDWTEISYMFVPETTGTYYLGFHSISPADVNFTIVDDIRVTEMAESDAGVITIISPKKGGSNASAVKATIKNFGSNTITSMDVAYQINSGTPVVETFTGNLAVGQTTDFEFSSTIDLSTYGLYELKIYTILSGDENADNDASTFDIYYQPSVQLYGYRSVSNGISAGQFVSFLSNDPGNMTVEKEFKDGSATLRGGDYVGGQLFGFTSTSNNPTNYIKFSESWDVISSSSYTTAGGLANDVAYDYTTNTMYAISGTRLLKIDMKTGAHTTVTTSLPATFMTLACDNTGQLYAISSAGGYYSVDKTNGAATLVRETGYAMQYIQSMTYDHGTGKIFWAYLNAAATASNLILIEPATGECYELGSLGTGITEVVMLYTPYDAVIARSFTPEEGTIPSDAPVAVTFNKEVTVGENLGNITITPDPGGVSASVTGTTLNIAHNNFNYQTSYTVNVPAGAVENLLGPYSWTFTLDLDPTQCNTPTEFVVSEIDFDSATLSWTENGSAQKWQIKYGDEDFDPDTEGTLIVAEENPYLLENLTSEYTYDVYVRSICNESPAEYSSWSTVATFKTLKDCSGGISSFPHIENFDGGATIPECWTATSMNTANSIIISTTAFRSGTSSLRFSSYSSASDYNQYLISPVLGTTTNSKEISFYYNSLTRNEKFKVGYSITDNNITNFTWIDDISANATNGWVEYYNIIPATAKYIAINYYSDYQYYLYVDDISINVLSDLNAAVLEIKTPNTGANLSTAEEVVVTVQNKGVQTISDFEISLELDDVNIATETVAQEIASGETSDYTFTATLDLSNFETYEIKVSVNLTGDEDESDNTITKEVENYNCVVTTFPWEFGFEENFSRCWNLVDNDEDNYNWKRGTTSGQAYSGTGYAYSESYYITIEGYVEGPLTPDNYMITPPFELPQTDAYEFTYRVGAVDPSFPAEQYEVMVSTTGIDPNDFTSVLSETLATAEWQQRKISLADYAGEKIYIAIRHNTPEGADQYQIKIDDLSVNKILDNDAALIEFVGIKDTEFGVSKDLDVKVELANFGVNEITAATINWSINGTAQTPYDWAGSLEYNETSVITIKTNENFVAGSYVLTAIVVVEDDENDTNNEIEFTFKVVEPESIPYSTEFDGSLENWSNESVASNKIWEWNDGSGNTYLNSQTGTAENGFMWYYILDNGYLGPDPAEANLVSPMFDFSTSSATNIGMSFNYTIKKYQTATLKIEASTDEFESDIQEMVSLSVPGADHATISGTQLVDLSQFAGETTVQIRFHFIGGGGYGAIIDDVSIFEIDNENDLAVINASVETKLLKEGDDVILYATVENMGFATQNDVTVTFNAGGQDLTTMIEEIAYGEKVDVNLTWQDVVAGINDITVSVPDDDMNTNNTFEIVKIVANNEQLAEGFETTFFPPAGWSRDSESWAQMLSSNVAGWIYEGSKSAFVGVKGAIYNDLKLITPLLNIEEGDWIIFYGMVGNYIDENNTPTIQIMYSTDKTDWTAIGNPIELTEKYERYKVDITGITGEYYLAFNASGPAYPNASYACNAVIDHVIGPKEIRYYDVTFNVTDKNDVEITDAIVTFNGVTNIAGNYSFENLLPGTYTYSVEKDGYKTVSGSAVVVDQDVSVDIVLKQLYTITATVDPAEAGTIEGSGGYAEDEEATIKATPATHYTFKNWTENDIEVSTDAEYTFTVTGDRTLVANFELKSYTITTSANPVEGGTVTPGGTYVYNTEITVVATENEGYEFVSWNANGSVIPGATISYTFNVTQDVNLVANFKTEDQVTYNITLDVSPQNSGTTQGEGTYIEGSSATVKAIANTHYEFENWTENDVEVYDGSEYTFNVTSDRTLVANFTVKSYTVSVSADPIAGGSVTGDGTYDYNEEVTVKATANKGYEFVNWKNGDTEVSTSAEYKFNIEENTSLTAYFKLKTYTVSVSADPVAGGSVTGGGTYDHNEEVTVKATANEGYEFVNWKEGNIAVSTSAEYKFNIVKNMNLVANFKTEDEVTYTVTLSMLPEGAGTLEGAGTYTEGEEVTIKAIANENYDFVNWTENGTEVSTSAEYKFNITKNISLVANFTSKTGVDTNSFDELSIYPNPFTNEINISDPALVKQVTVTNMAGQKVMEIRINGEQKFSTEDLPAGVYFISFEGINGDNMVKKMVKQ